MRKAGVEAVKFAVGYTRVSTQDQAREGVSLADQRQKIEAWAQSKGVALRAVHEDAGVSGKSTEGRPGLAQALDEVSRVQGVLVVSSMSRVSRSTRDMLTIAQNLEDAGADLVSLTESIDTTGAAGRMVFRMLAVLGEFERDLVSERTKSALAYKKSKGEAISRAPRGLKIADNGQLEVDPASDGLVLAQRARELRAQGLTYQAIADQLTTEGFKPAPNPSTHREGTRFYPSSARWLVVNPDLARHSAA
jgi:DNA invertase Pin-like site-specific DNA recombinase